MHSNALLDRLFSSKPILLRWDLIPFYWSVTLARGPHIDESHASTDAFGISLTCPFHWWDHLYETVPIFIKLDILMELGLSIDTLRIKLMCLSCFLFFLFWWNFSVTRCLFYFLNIALSPKGFSGYILMSLGLP